MTEREIKQSYGVCGLVCALCSYNTSCPGCRCKSDDCDIKACCREKGLDYCFECKDYPCGKDMHKGIRSRAFNTVAKTEGLDKLAEYLYTNYNCGITYHRSDKLTGDYDKCETVEEVTDLLKNGKPNPYMELEIRRLTPEMLDDYLNFFDNVAFADHPDWAQCYCLAFHFEPAWDAEDVNLENPWRKRAIQFVREGKVQGFLAYADNRIVGWCNANDRTNYAALKYNVKPEINIYDESRKIKSVVCFLVAPEMRGKGIATKLLERVCTDAEADGYDFIEGYPPAGTSDMYAAHHGTVALFEKCGFAIHKQLDNDCIMRKYLGDRR